VDRIRQGLATAREGEARDLKGLAEEWKRLQQIQRSDREEALPVGLERSGVKRILCPLPQAVSSGGLNRDSGRRIRIAVPKKVSPVKLARDAVRQIRGAGDAALVPLRHRCCPKVGDRDA
jgi:hypothetical protein